MLTPADDLIIAIEGDKAQLLIAWNWLLTDKSLEPILATALGDLFLRRADGSIHRLDVCRGKIVEVATDDARFRTLLADPASTNAWFRPALVAKIRKLVPDLQPGECYSYKLPPVVGGDESPENFEPTSLVLHFGLLGQLHEQSRRWPDGTPIRRFVDAG